MAKRRPRRSRLAEAITVDSMSFDLKTVIAIVLWAVSLAGLYWGLSGQIGSQALATANQTTTIQGLLQRVETSEKASRDQERALIELTVTLKTKGVMK